MPHLVKSEKSIARLRDRLEAIASLMEASARYTPMEIYAWRLLSAYVDQDHFDRTGQVITVPLAPEDLAPKQTSEAARLALAELNRALQALEAREHLAPVSRRRDAPASKSLQYRLYLQQAFAQQPEY